MPAVEIVYTNPTLEDLPDDRCKTAYQFWLAARAGADLPPPEAIDVLMIPRSILPQVSIYDVEEGEKHFRFRFVGPAVAGAIGFDPTGTYFDDVPGSSALIGRLLDCVEARQPYFYQGPLFWRNVEIPAYRTLVMPFAKRGAPVALVMTFSESYRSPGAQA